MTRKNDGKSELSSGGADRDSGAGGERGDDTRAKKEAFFAGYDTGAKDGIDNYQAFEAYQRWLAAPSGDQGVDGLHPGNAR